MKGWGLTPEGLGCELQTTQVTGIQGRETSGWQAPGGLDPWHSEAVRPWVSPSTFLSLRETRGPLWSPVLMPAGHGLKIYVECQVLCLANGNCSGKDCDCYDARKSASPSLAQKPAGDTAKGAGSYKELLGIRCFQNSAAPLPWRSWCHL